MTIYRPMMVVGFAFRERRVLLVHKTRPEWQAGLLNGVGGKSEPGETEMQTMVREFREEAGVDVPSGDWRKVCTEMGPTYELHAFACNLNDEIIREENDVGETLVWFPVETLMERGRNRVVGNLQWMIPLALDPRWYQSPPVLMINDDIREKATW